MKLAKEYLMPHVCNVYFFKQKPKQQKNHQPLPETNHRELHVFA